MKQLIIWAAMAGGVNAAGFAIDGNTMAAAGVLIGTITLTIAVVTWIDRRIDTKIKPLSEQMEELRASVLGQPRRPPNKRG